jgi:UDP-N-acetylglucosamine--N-acetylmuramyl-(pentapeptide) pyrophosphoryl-undecaprenol N-acetylglucosamine transferase
LSPQVVPVFVGALRGIEKDVLPQSGFEHELLDLHPLYRTRPWRNWKTIMGALQSWGSLRRMIASWSPAAALGTGGYAAGLALRAAHSARVPVVLQEQNSYPGLTTRYLCRFAREVYMGFPEAASHLKRARHGALIDTGNPIEPPPDPRPRRAELLGKWGFPADAGHVLLVVGGSQGARPINAALAASIDSLTSLGLHIIWATGKANFAPFAALASQRVRVVPYLAPISDAYAVATLALCRSGAITTAELCAWGIPSILVPLPTAAANHQMTNANALERAGCSVVLRQDSLDGTRLVAAITALVTAPARLDAMAAAALSRGRPQAAEVIAKRILTICHIM